VYRNKNSSAKGNNRPDVGVNGVDSLYNCKNKRSKHMPNTVILDALLGEEGLGLGYRIPAIRVSSGRPVQLHTFFTYSSTSFSGGGAHLAIA